AGGVDSADSASLTVTIDTLNPSGDFSIVGTMVNGQLVVKNPNLALLLSYDGTGSPLTTMEFSFDGGTTYASPEDYDTVGALTLPNTDGLYTIAVRITDTAGNQTVTTHTVRLDTSGPKITYNLSCANNICDVGQTVTFTYSATDANGVTFLSATLV